MARPAATSKVKAQKFAAWWDANVERAPDAWQRSDELYKNYAAYVGKANTLGGQAFARAFEERDVRQTMRNGYRGRLGVRLKRPDYTPTKPAKAVHLPKPKASLRDPVAAHAERVGDATPPPYLQDALSRTGDVHEVDEIKVTLALPPARALPPMWRLTPLTGGVDPEKAVLLEANTPDDEASAGVAWELFAERRRQQCGEDHTHADDDALPQGELASMAAAFAFAASVRPAWLGWLKPRTGGPAREIEGYQIMSPLRLLWRRSLETFKAASPRAMLVKAGALIIAAIEIIDRAEARNNQGRS